MSYRYMRLIVFFDLPRYTAKEVKEATLFPKNLIKDGFLMLQESVYCKLVLNLTALNALKNRVKKYLPESGSVMMLSVTEKQFQDMDICLEQFKSNVYDKDNRLLIL